VTSQACVTATAFARQQNLLMKSKDKKGCQELQDALGEYDRPDKDKAVLGEAYRGHVWEVIQDENANLVLQKYVAMIGPKYTRFILDELMRWEGGVCIASRHIFGCRVILRLLEHMPPQQVKALAQEICQNIRILCMNKYGIHIVLHLLESHEHSSPVAYALLLQRDLVVLMARSEQNHIVKAVVHLLYSPGDLAKTAVCLLSEAFHVFRGQPEQLPRYQRVIVKHLDFVHFNFLQQEGLSGVVLVPFSFDHGDLDFDWDVDQMPTEQHVVYQ